MSKDFVYDEFVLMFPRIAEHVEFWEHSDDMEIRLILDDGMEMRYDSLDKTIRRVIYHDEDDIDEIVWRREFARNLNRQMMHNHMSQETLSILTGISRRMINNYATGKASPTGFSIRRLAKALECDYNDLIRIS